MHQSVKLTDAICLLQLLISSSLIHALGDPNQAPTGNKITYFDGIDIGLINYYWHIFHLQDQKIYSKL